MDHAPLTSVETVVDDLEAALARRDVEGLVALFAEDATIESFLVSRVLDRSEGVCRGRGEIRELVRALVQRGVPWGGHDRPMIRGETVAIEYRTADGGERFSVDVIEVRDGRIQSLRAYAGWRALAAVAADSKR